MGCAGRADPTTLRTRLAAGSRLCGGVWFRRLSCSIDPCCLRCVPPVVLVCAVDARAPDAPPTRLAPVTDTYHGVSVADPYRWLEDGTATEVREWTAAQTARTRAYLDPLPFRSALEAQLVALTSQSSPSYRDFKSAGGQLFLRYNDPAKQQATLAVMTVGAVKPRVFLDPNLLDPSGGTAIDWYVPLRLHAEIVQAAPGRSH